MKTLTLDLGWINRLKLEDFEIRDTTWEDYHGSRGTNYEFTIYRKDRSGFFDNGEVSAESIKAWFESPSYKSVFNYNPKFFTDILLKRRIAYYTAGEVVPRKLPNGEYSRAAFYREGTQYPLLKELEFQRHMNPFLCFQDIERFLNNDVASPDSPRILPVPDKIKAQSHGFDKFSFRRGKT